MRSSNRPTPRVFVGCALLAALGSAVAADAARFRRLGVEDGISHTSVWDVERDARGFVWVTTETSVQRYDGYEFKDYLHDPLDPHSLSSQFAYETLCDRRGRLWIYSEFGGLDLYDRERDHFDRIDLPAGIEFVQGMVDDSEGNLWLPAFGVGLVRLEPETGRTRVFGADQGVDHRTMTGVGIDSEGSVWLAHLAGVLRLRHGAAEFENVEIEGEPNSDLSSLAVSGDDRVWLGSSTGAIYRLDRATDRFVEMRAVGSALDSLAVSPQGVLWFGTPEGLVVYDPALDRVDRHRYDDLDPDSLSADETFGIAFGAQGEVWVGTRNGVSILDPSRSAFEVVRSRRDGGGLVEGSAQAIATARDGSVWIGMANGAISRWSLESGEIETVFDVDRAPVGTIDAVTVAGNGEIVLAGLRGLAHVDPTTRRVVAGSRQPELVDVRGLVETADGAIWYASASLGVVRVEDGVVEPAPLVLPEGAPSATSAYSVFLDRSGSIWFGLLRGMLRVDPTSREVTVWTRDPENPTGLGGDLVSAFHEDEAGQLWIATYGSGLDRFDRERGEFVHYREADGLASDFVVGILEDADGRLWLSTNRGLSAFDPEAGTFENYYAADGLASDVFLMGGWTDLDDGTLVFSGHAGVTAFHPDRLLEDTSPPPVVLTKLLLAGSLAKPGAEGSPLELTIGETEELTLEHGQNTFAVEFSALDFANPDRNRFAFRLDGLDDEWTEVDASNRRARYTKLRPGDYRFRVRASDARGVWNDVGATLDIRVLPPWWQTWWAMSLYTLSLVGAVIGYSAWQQRRLEKERETNARLRQVDRLKNEFLANTSHELRTPLFGITGLAESLVDGARGDLGEDAVEDLEMIVTSGRRLGSLVDDILDFSRLQDREVDLELTAVSLPSLVDLVVTLSRPLAEGKQVDLVNAVPRDLPPVHGDENRLQQVFLNLIGNAIKFTDRGSVVVSGHLSEGRVVVDVEDTGIGIAPDEIERVFEPFEQADASASRAFGGTGLGLAITRDLVALHGGSLTAESVVGEGSRFRFTLRPSDSPTTPAVSLTRGPSRAVGSRARESAAGRAAGESHGKRATRATTPSTDDSAKTILVVDDEPVVRKVLLNQLMSHGYRVLEAKSGPEALRLLEHEPDLVLLDIMMPRMSGFEVCDSIRRRYSIDQLPVIFLSAKSQVEDLLHGFATGANDYVSKPVTKDELIVRVKTHLKLRDLNINLERLVAERTDQVKRLGGMLPICSSCKKIRDDDGYWRELENFLDQHSDATLTHGLCDHCVRNLYPELETEVGSSTVGSRSSES